MNSTCSSVALRMSLAYVEGPLAKLRPSSTPIIHHGSLTQRKLFSFILISGREARDYSFVYSTVLTVVQKVFKVDGDPVESSSSDRSTVA